MHQELREPVLVGRRVSWQDLKQRKDRPRCLQCTIAMSPFRIHFDKAVWLCQESGCTHPPGDVEEYMVDLEVPLALMNRLQAHSISTSQGSKPNQPRKRKTTSRTTNKSKRSRSASRSVPSILEAVSPAPDTVSTDHGQCCSSTARPEICTSEPFPLRNLPGEDTDDEDNVSPELAPDDQQFPANSPMKPGCIAEIDQLISLDEDEQAEDQSWMLDDDRADQLSPAEACSESEYRNVST